MTTIRRTAFVAAAALALVPLAAPQFRQILKVVGVGAAVKQFGPQINKEFNKLLNHTDTAQSSTKVVPILTVGLSTSTAVGAAQVMGPKAQVDKVEAVAQPSAELFGREFRIRGFIPVSSRDVLKDIKRVDNVAVTGVMDIKL
ncbi:MAG TPA: hypothetical protein DER07_04395 [Armatimonadetes bacterium]|jgi:hypothetical protein|nr:hypothetical protein [Armatimonadota bacterium]MCA1997500.1 hypothetical protein [Armatimonadota bacterium]HCE00259.1 hypothetical protein [Armatimonadota bacterium]